MGGSHIDALFGVSIDPSAENATAWKYQGVLAVPLDDGQFKIAVERRARYGLPLHTNLMDCLRRGRFDLDHCLLLPDRGARGRYGEHSHGR
jgi:hypothetical protein